MTLGLVCDACDALAPLSATSCPSCSAALGVNKATRPAAGAPPPETAAPAKTAAAPAKACTFCGTPLIPHHRFCGNCGRPVPTAAPAEAPQATARPGAKTMFFGAMQVSSPKLILIKGEGMDGITYVLSSTEHVAGRREGAILFPEDPLLSPRHANFIWRDHRLVVRDEGSTNGIFVRILKPLAVAAGATFLVGEQLLRVDACPIEEPPSPDEEGTYFYGSPKRASKVALTQLLAGGREGSVYRARDHQLTIGREGNDLDFPDDPFISGHHATVTATLGADGVSYQIADLGSKNGTFVRIAGEAPLFHGDYVFLGQQLLRVEIT